MNKSSHSIQRTYSLSIEVLDKLEDLLIKKIVKKEKSSRSALVAQAIGELWDREKIAFESE